LAELQPELAARLNRLPSSGNLKLVQAHSQDPVPIKNGLSLHSRRDPWAEARAFARSEPVDQAVRHGLIPLIFGLGGGYHVLALLERFDRLVVYESDPALIRTALETLDWSAALSRLIFLTGPDQLPKERQPFALLVHRPTQRLAAEDWASFLAVWEGKTAPVPAEEGQRWKVLLVSPLNGGSLPLAGHVDRALRSLGHEAILADMSPLDPFHRSLRSAGLPVEKIEPATQRLIQFAGEYIAFLTEVHRPHLLLALAQAPLDRRALNRIRSLGVKTAFWFVEDHRLLTYFQELAGAYDYFFHIQGREMEEALRRAGARKWACLPLAADPDLFVPLPRDERLAPYRAELSFMGAGYPNRRRVFEKLLDRDLKIWGSDWDLTTRLGTRVQDRGRRVPTEETVLIYNAATINLNLHSSFFEPEVDAGGHFINPRTFEIAACAAFQLVDRRPPLDEYFDLETEMAAFSDFQELRDKIDGCLARPELRVEMANKARERVLANHTYQHRMRALLEFIRLNEMPQPRETDPAEARYAASLCAASLYAATH